MIAMGDTAVKIAFAEDSEDNVWTNVLPVLQVEVADEYNFAV